MKAPLQQSWFYQQTGKSVGPDPASPWIYCFLLGNCLWESQNQQQYVGDMACGCWPIAAVVTHVQWEPLETDGSGSGLSLCLTLSCWILLRLHSHCSACRRNSAWKRLVMWARLPGKGDIPGSKDDGSSPLTGEALPSGVQANIRLLKSNCILNTRTQGLFHPCPLWNHAFLREK